MRTIHSITPLDGFAAILATFGWRTPNDSCAVRTALGGCPPSNGSAASITWHMTLISEDVRTRAPDLVLRPRRPTEALAVIGLLAFGVLCLYPLLGAQFVLVD